jgi:hypothetical protein
MTFLTGVLMFGVASLRARVLPAAAVALYLLGFAPAALRGIVPEAVYLGGLTVGAVAVVWLSTALLGAGRETGDGPHENRVATAVRAENRV